MVKDTKAKEMYEWYNKGYSLEMVGKMFGVSRQSVYDMFKARKLSLRTKKKLPFITFKNNKYTLRNTGYYGMTYGKRTLLHRDVWESILGKIPKGYDIHHKNHNKTDNRIENLELYTKSEHAKKFNSGRNQYSK